MKKVLLVLMVLASAFLFALPRAYAVEPAEIETPHDINYAGLWELDEVASDVWAMVLEIEFTMGTLSELSIKIPAYPDYLQTYGGIESTLIVMGGAGTITSGDLDAYVVLQSADTINMTFIIPSISTLSMTMDDADIVTTNYVFIRIMLNTAVEPDSTVVDWYRYHATAIGVTANYHILFFDRGTLLGYTEISAFLGGDVPTNPTPPTDYEFSSWRTITGEVAYKGRVLLQNINNLDYVVKDAQYGLYIPLYSFFTLDDTATEVTPTDTPGSQPTWISGPLGMIGLDNEAGYFLLYAIIAIMLIVFAVLKLGGENGRLLSLVGLLVWTGIGTWLALIPMWGTYILIAANIGFLIMVFMQPSTQGGSEV